MQPRLTSSRQRAASVRASKPAGLTHVLAPAVLVAFLEAGCSQVRPYVPPSEGHIAAKPRADAEQVIPPPARMSSFVPPPQPAVKLQTYSVVVNEVPVKELLNALARDTRQNIDIHPGLQGLVSLNAVDETLPAILERIARQVNLRFRQEGNTIVVTPDTPYMKTYRINYVNVTRNISSTVSVAGEVGSAAVSGGAQGGAGSPGASGAGGGGSRTTVTSTTSNDFWEQLRDNVRAILISTARVAASAEEKAARAEDDKTAREEAIRRADAVSRAGAGAADLLRSAFPQSMRPAASLQQTDTGTDVIINPISGTISVLGTERQHQLIQHHLDSISSSVQRQVLIEATIVEVVLSDAYQAGVNWSRLAVSGGVNVTQMLGGGFAAAAAAAGATAGNSLTVGYQNPTSRVGNISATIQLLQEFGNTRVLSSPKVMAINNQTALLKVVDNIVYFEVQAQQGLITASGTQTPPTFTSTPRTVSVGVVMGVTPQINEDGRVTLTVRPTISRLLRFTNDPNPSLCNDTRTNCVPNPVPEIQVREMESVLQVATGQTVILGGLMQDEATFNREQIPVIGNIKDVGELFRFRNERVRKTELVIFLRPIVITNPTLDSDELKFFQRFLPQVGSGAAAGTGHSP
ncbi:MAG: biosis protein MshL [Betaproteobacteria bacterium]